MSKNTPAIEANPVRETLKAIGCRFAYKIPTNLARGTFMPASILQLWVKTTIPVRC